jgi:uncharacterized protein (DUF1697 family)
MPRYAAFLRGVTPMNCKMKDLAHAFESAGFENVKTVLASGNVAFDASKASTGALEKKAEAAMRKALGREFFTIVRPLDEVAALLAKDPYRPFKVPPEAKRVVTFLREAPAAKPKLPLEKDGARVLVLHGHELFTAYVPLANQPVFMTLIEKVAGKEQTTRTWQTVEKVAAA